MQLAAMNLGQILVTLSSIECHGCAIDPLALIVFPGSCHAGDNYDYGAGPIDNETRSDASCESVYVQPHFTLTSAGIVSKPTYSFTITFFY